MERQLRIEFEGAFYPALSEVIKEVEKRMVEDRMLKNEINELKGIIIDI